MPDIQAFRSRLGEGGVRPNQFLVRINWPSVCPSGLSLDGLDNLLVTGAAAPASHPSREAVNFELNEGSGELRAPCSAVSSSGFGEV